MMRTCSANRDWAKVHALWQVRAVCREYTLPRDEKENCAKWWIKSDARGTALNFKTPSSSEDQTTSWIRMVNGVDKFVREAMPIQEEEKASVKPAAKARPILKASSTSGWDFTLVEQRQWIDIETQASSDSCCFQVSEFITRILQHSQQVNREEDAGVHYDQVVDECKKKLSDDTGYWSDELKKQFANAPPYWSFDKWISVLAKGGAPKKWVQCWKRLEPTHGDVLNLHTVFFFSRSKPRHTHTTHHTPQTQPNTHNTPHTQQYTTTPKHKTHFPHTHSQHIHHTHSQHTHAQHFNTHAQHTTHTQTHTHTTLTPHISHATHPHAYLDMRTIDNRP